jgi:hypothetical protein
MKNIRTELTQEQTRLVIAAINAEIIKGSGTFLSESDVYNLGTVMNKLKIHLNFASQ